MVHSGALDWEEGREGWIEVGVCVFVCMWGGGVVLSGCRVSGLTPQVAYRLTADRAAICCLKHLWGRCQVASWQRITCPWGLSMHSTFTFYEQPPSKHCTSDIHHNHSIHMVAIRLWHVMENLFHPLTVVSSSPKPKMKSAAPSQKAKWWNDPPRHLTVQCSYNPVFRLSSPDSEHCGSEWWEKGGISCVLWFAIRERCLISSLPAA